MACCTCMSRTFLIGLNIFFCAVGGTLVFLGSFIFHEYSAYSHNGVMSLGTALLPAVILIIVGVVAVLLGFIGFAAACSEQKCIAGLYFTMLLLLLLGLVTGGVLGFLYHRQIDDGLYKVLIQNLDNYNSDKDIKFEVDLIQNKMKCCGVNNYTDWLDTPWHHNQSTTESLPYPESCCKGRNCTYTQQPDPRLYTKGCYELVRYEFKHHLLIIASVAAAFAILLLLGMITSCTLVIQKRRSRENPPYIGIPEPDGITI